MLLFGTVGYLFNKLDLPHAPLILAMILGSMMERGLYQSLTLSGGSLMIFVQNPICLVMLIAAAFFAVAPLIKYFTQKNQNKGVA